MKPFIRKLIKLSKDDSVTEILISTDKPTKEDVEEAIDCSPRCVKYLTCMHKYNWYECSVHFDFSVENMSLEFWISVEDEDETLRGVSHDKVTMAIIKGTHKKAMYGDGDFEYYLIKGEAENLLE